MFSPASSATKVDLIDRIAGLAEQVKRDVEADDHRSLGRLICAALFVELLMRIVAIILRLRAEMAEGDAEAAGRSDEAGPRAAASRTTRTRATARAGRPSPACPDEDRPVEPDAPVPTKETPTSAILIGAIEIGWFDTGTFHTDAIPAPANHHAIPRVPIQKIRVDATPLSHVHFVPLS